MSTCLLSGPASPTRWAVRSATELYCKRVLSSMSWPLLSQEYAAGQHRWGILWDDISTFVPHDASGTSKARSCCSLYESCLSRRSISWRRVIVLSRSNHLNVDTVIVLFCCWMDGLIERHIQDMIPAKPGQTYVPRVYGFRVHESSLFYQNHEDGSQDPTPAADERQSRRSRDRSRRK